MYVFLSPQSTHSKTQSLPISVPNIEEGEEAWRLNDNEYERDLPENTLPVPSHFTLQLQHAIKECFRRRWATRYVDIDGYNTYQHSKNVEKSKGNAES